MACYRTHLEEYEVEDLEGSEAHVWSSAQGKKLVRGMLPAARLALYLSILTLPLTFYVPVETPLWMTRFLTSTTVITSINRHHIDNNHLIDTVNPADHPVQFFNVSPHVEKPEERADSSTYSGMKSYPTGSRSTHTTPLASSRFFPKFSYRFPRERSPT